MKTLQWARSFPARRGLARTGAALSAVWIAWAGVGTYAHAAPVANGSPVSIVKVADESGALYDIDCRNKSIGNTGGHIDCKGHAKMRLKSICGGPDTDKYSAWTDLNTNTYQRFYAVDCTFSLHDIEVQAK
ncbi:hypothetical protein ACFTWH_35690 [Streptomyces sp. NPDC057011]|uniref:hypothetical protein n=1 Tax=unclassified Streptomyces TaxID=2593676 RepID=UPI003642C102